MIRPELDPRSKSNRSTSATNVLVSTKYRFIGDTLLAVPLIRAISRSFPGARISLLTGAKAIELLQNCPYLESTIEFDPYRASDKGAMPYLKLISELRKKRFDYAFICNRSFHSALTAFLAAARYRIGWSGFEGRDFLLTNKVSYDRDACEVNSYLDLLRDLDLQNVVDPSLSLWLTDSERNQARGYFANSGLTIALQPGATHDEKRWPVEKYSELIIHLMRSRQDIRFILIGGKEEAAFADQLYAEVSSGIGELVTNLVGKTSLREALAVISYCNLFISGDTAMRHCAVALDTPSIALFGPTSINKWGNTASPRHLAIQSETNRVVDIPVESVYKYALDIITSVSMFDNLTRELAEVKV